MGNVQKLYKALVSKGYSTDDIGDEKTFTDKMKERSNRKQLFDYVSSRNDFRIGDFENYEKRLISDYTEDAGVPTETYNSYAETGNGYDPSSSTYSGGKGTQEEADRIFAEKQKEFRISQNKGDSSYENSYWGNVEPVDWRSKKQKLRDEIMYGGKATPVSRDGEPIYPIKPREVSYSEAISSVNLPTPLDNQLEDRLKANEEALKKAYQRESEERNAFAQEHPFISAMGAVRSPRPMDADDEIQNLLAEREYLTNAKKVMNAARNDSGFFAGVEDAVSTPSFYDFGFTDLRNSGRVLGIKKKLDEGADLTPSEQSLLTSLGLQQELERQYSGLTGRMYRAGKTTAEMAPFMAEMALNPASGLGKAAAKAATKKFGKNGVKALSAKVAARTAGDVAGATSMALTSGMPSTVADAIDRYAGEAVSRYDSNGNLITGGLKNGESISSSIGKAVGSRAIENWSEMVGQYFAPIGSAVGKLGKKVLGKFGLDKVNQFIDSVNSSDMAKLLDDFGERTAWSGNFGEFAEEQIGTIANSLIVGDSQLSDLTDWDKQLDTALGVGVFGSAMSLLRTAGYRTPRYRARKSVERSDKIGSEAFGEAWEDIKNNIDNSESDEQLKQSINEVVLSPDYTEAQKKAVIEYSINLKAQQAVNTIKEKKKLDEGFSVENQVEDSYDNGTEIVDPAEKHSAKRTLETLESSLGFDSDNEQQRIFAQKVIDGQGNISATLEELNKEGYSPEQIQLATEYYNALYLYNGMAEATIDRINEKVAVAEEKVDANINEDDGTIIPVMLKDGSEGYVVKGKIAVDSEGDIDINNSDNVIFIRDINGNVRMKNPRDLLSRGTIQSPETLKEILQGDVRSKLIKESQDEIDYNPDTPDPTQGESYINPDGEDMTVVGVDGQGGMFIVPTKDYQSANGNQKKMNELISGAMQLGVVPVDEFKQWASSQIDAEKEGEQEQTNSVLSEKEVVEENPPSNIANNISEEMDQAGNESTPSVEEDISSSVINEPYASVSEEQMPSSAIPLDEKGNPIYHMAKIEDTIADLMDGTLEDIEVDEFISANRKEAVDNIAKLESKPPKIGTNKAKYVQKKKEWQSLKDEQQKRVDYWNEVERQIKSIREKPGDSIAEEIISMEDPLNGEEFAAQQLANGNIRLLQSSFSDETGFGKDEIKKYFGLFASAEKGGMTIQEAGEYLMQADRENGTNFFDQNDPNAGRDAIINILSQAGTRGELANFIKSNSEMMAERERAEEYSAYEQWCENYFHMTPKEYETYESVIYDDIEKRALTDEQYNDFMSTFVDEQINKKEDGQQRIYNQSKGSGEVLHGAQSISPGRVAGTTEGREEVDGGIYSEDGAVSKSSYGRNVIDIFSEAKRISKERDIEKARASVNINPTEAQKEAGNYKKGHIKLDGYEISIENPKGSERSGIDNNGQEWHITMNNDYGYIRGTKAVDGDHIDIFLSDNPIVGNVFVVDQLNEKGEFDESKVMYGFSSADEARSAYLSNYSPGWENRVSAITEVTKDDFKKWIDSSVRKTKPFSEYKSVNPVQLAPSIESANAERMKDIEARLAEIEDRKIELDDILAEVGDNSIERDAVFSEQQELEKEQHELEAEYSGLREMNDESNNILASEGSDIRFREVDIEEISSFANKHKLSEADVKKYAQSMNAKNLGGASYAFKSISKDIRLQNSGLSLGQFVKAFSPIKKELYEKFGDVDALRDEYVQHEMESRNVMEAARKRAEEEAEAEKKRLEEFVLMTDEEMDSAYFSAMEANDETRMRDIVNEAARRNGYVSADEFRMAHRAPSYDEEGIDKSMVDVAANKDQIRESLNEQLRMNRDKYKDESASAINAALSAIDKGEKPTVTIYRAVPKSLKEGKVRNGDWVSLSESYVKVHGEHALNGDYKVMKEEVPAENLYWDGNDINEWGYDDRSDYRYRDTKNNRKLNDLITRDDKGNVIPPSKRFNARKADVRFRFIGEKGASQLDKAEEATFRLDNLSVAREMEESGKDAKAIKLATGWERGADGKWRYETDDFDIDVKGLARRNSLYENLSWGKELDSLSDKLFDGVELTEEEAARFDELSEMADELRKSYEENNVRYLDDYVKDKELFKAYPELKQIRVEMYDDPVSDIWGIWHPDQNLIRVNEPKLEYGDFRSTLAHEVQHAVQAIEGFANGGNPSDILEYFNDNQFDINTASAINLNIASNISKKADELMKKGKYRYRKHAVRGAIGKMREIYPEKYGYDGYIEELAYLYTWEELRDAYNKAIAEGRTEVMDYKKADHKYIRLIGEVEARNVEARMDMTAEERRNSLASETEDVSRKDQIFITDALNNNNNQLSLSQEKISANENKRVEQLYGGNDKIRKTIEEASNSRGGDRAATANGRSGTPKQSLLGKIVQRAKENGTWIEDVSSIADFYIGHGQENEVFLSKDGTNVIKLNNLDFLPDDSINLNDFFNRAFSQNKLFPADSFTIIGFSENSKGETCVVLQQPYITNATEATSSQIDKFLEEMGFTVDMNDIWFDGRYEISDLKTSNVLVDGNGRLRFIDSIVKDTLFQQKPLNKKVNLIEKAVDELSESLHTPIKKITSADQIPQGEARRRIESGANIKGWYSPKENKVFLYMPNTTSVEDAQATIFHEVVAHKGLRDMFGKDFDEFLNNVYNNVSDSIRSEINRMAINRYGGNFRVATEEYLASLAERGPVTKEERTLWQKIKDLFVDLLRKANIDLGFELTDNELRYILWRSTQNLQNTNPLDVARNMAMEHKLGVDVNNRYKNLDTEKQENTEEDKKQEEIDKLRKEISNLKRNVTNLRKSKSNFEVQQRAVIAFINQRLTKEVGDELGSTRIKQLLSMVNHATTAKDLRPPLQYLEQLINSATYESVAKRMGKLIKIKLVSQTARGVSKGVKVDETTRQIFDSVRATFKDLLSTSVDSELRSVRGDIARIGKELKSLPEDNSDIRTALENRQNELKKRRNELENEKEELLTKNAIDTIEGLVERERELTNAKDEYKNEKKGIWTQEMDNELNAIPYRKKLAEIRKQINDMDNILTDAVNARQNAYKVSGNKRKALLSEAETNENLYTVAQQDLIKMTNEVYLDLKELIDTGKSNLANLRKEKEAHRKEIVNMAIEAVKKNRPESVNKKARGNTIAENIKECLQGVEDFVFATLGSFNFMLKAIDRNHSLGDGPLYKYFMQSDNGAKAAIDNRDSGIRDFKNEVDNKIKEIFGKNMDLIKISKLAKNKKVDVTKIYTYDSNSHKAGEEYTDKRSIAQCLYIWLSWRQADGRIKLEAEGWTEDNIEKLEEKLGDDYMKLGEWLTDDFLPRLRDNKYNMTHIKLFGTSMASREHYFPLSIFKSAITEKGELGENVQTLPTTVTGNIINRTVNKKPVDESLSAFDVLMKYAVDMEQWNATAILREDLNYLHGSMAFRNYMEANHKGSFKQFMKAAEIAVGAFEERIAEENLNKGFLKVQRLWTGSNIGFRLGTAMKQVLSYPAFLSYSMSPSFLKDWSKYLFTPLGNYRWAYNNLPSFRQRVDSGNFGNIQLKKVDGANSMEGFLDKFNKAGMWPNKTVDALTVAAGARCVYNLELKRAKERGMSDEEADNMARYQAEIVFNESQQSSSEEFISPMQASHSLFPRSLMAYQNSNVGYQRIGVEGLLDISRAKRVYQIDIENGMSEEEAKKKMRSTYYRGVRKASFGLFILGGLWGLGSQGIVGLTGELLSNLIGNGDDDKWLSDEDLKEITTSAIVSSVAGTSVGQFVGSYVAGREYNPIGFLSDIGDLATIIKNEEFGLPLMMKISSTGIKLFTGINLETFENIYLGAEWVIRKGRPDLVDFMFLINLPASQRKEISLKLYNDLGPFEYLKKQKEAQKMFDDYRKNMPYAKNVTPQKENEIKREYVLDKMDKETQESFEKEKEFKKLKRKYDLSTDREEWLKKHPDFKDMERIYGKGNATKKINREIKRVFRD